MPVATTSTAQGGTTQSGSGTVGSDNPLASLLQPTPGPSVAAPGGTLASPSPNSILPGSQSSQDFTTGNQRAGANSQTLLAQGDAAFKAGQVDQAIQLWQQAVGAGPGSPASMQAQERIMKYGSTDAN